MNELIDKAAGLDKWSLGRLITLFEDTRTSAAARRRDLLDLLEAREDCRDAVFIGVTGSPGSGKSSLIGELATRTVAADDAVSVAVLAVDPTSHVSGGALLGDRTRVRFPADENRLFFRSQASDRDLGGVGRTTFQVCRLLRYLFDFVFVETVGIGQSEIEIQHVADWTYLVLQPMAGDQIQFMKAGIMEIPDAFVLNKCDLEDAARQSYNALVGSQGLVRPGASGPLTIHRTSTVTGAGLGEVVAEIRGVGDRRRSMLDKEQYFFEKWVRDQYGRVGLALLRADPARAVIDRAGSFDAAQVVFDATFRGQLGGGRDC